MMERYYDAHLYLANWGTRHLMLRLPRAALSPGTVEPYLVPGMVDAWATNGHTIVACTSDDEPEWDDDEPDGLLQTIICIREELAAGDLRPLYLAWLAAYATWERDEDAFKDEAEDIPEPPAPSGLTDLTPPQKAFADFLRLDPDLLTVTRLLDTTAEHRDRGRP